MKGHRRKQVVPKYSPQLIRKGMLKVEADMRKIPGVKLGDAACPLKHVFADKQYIRQITMPKGMLIVSKLHKTTHPYFVLKGDVSVLTEKGVVRIKAPFSGITKAGTKRVLYVHEESIWVTIHVTQETDLEKIEAQVIANTYDDLPEDVKRQLPKDKKEITETKLLTFVKEVSKLKEEKCGN